MIQAASVPGYLPTTGNLAVTATPGSVVVANNVIYGPGYSTMLQVASAGAVITGNVFDFGGFQPLNQPIVGNYLNSQGGTHRAWPIPNGSAVQIAGNDIIVEANIFRNANVAGTANPNAVGIFFPPTFPPAVSPDVIRILIKGNIFDATIGVPVRNNAMGGNLTGVRILDNIGINPVGVVGTVTVPASGAAHAIENPFPYDCFVSISAPMGTTVANVILNGVPTGVGVAPNDQKSFLVKAGGSIGLIYSGSPSWTWVGL